MPKISQSVERCGEDLWSNYAIFSRQVILSKVRVDEGQTHPKVFGCLKECRT